MNASTKNNHAALDRYEWIYNIRHAVVMTTWIKEQYGATNFFQTYSITMTRHNKHHVTHSVCTWCTKMSCAFLSFLSFYFIICFLSILCITIFLHLSILAPVGIGKRCSSLSSMTPPPLMATDQCPPETLTACPLILQSTSWSFL